MSGSKETPKQPALVKLMSWIATIVFLVLLIYIVYYAATYEPPEEESLWIFWNLIR
jgi:hypothetical protein